MSDIFHEVDEDVRRDKAANLWKRYQTPVIVGAFLVVVATGVYSFYESNRIKAAEGANVRFGAAAALATQGKSAEALAAFEAVVKDAPRGYATLARLRAAEELALSDKAKAVAAFDAIAEDKGVDKLTQQVAKLRAGVILLEQGERQKMADHLGELVIANGPFRYTAQELLGLDALQDSDFDEAERAFKIILNDQEAPHAMRQRAGAFKALLDAARGSSSAATPAPAAPAPAK
ncbi:tetratricopeptide repeat protein [Methylosinus sp. H3A]|uniref:tetratricopeptide repeat protein n=1 Tax=Methylosinus sp. H3A TaxID=2785786 RepID=UPI0018C33359|nr:tetratricopeptide repeat protein [Methylosinus sp. H3A]MBG0810905.1 tetratricopeptide repeat protein [Methylosinus sp. H3A]